MTVSAPSKPRHVAIVWHGLPAYAAHLIRAALDRHHGGLRIDLVGTRPSVPIEGMEDILGRSVNWLDDAETPVEWGQIGLEVPQIVIHTGWAYPAFNALAAQVRARGGRVVSIVDNNYKGNVRQFVGAYVYRFKYRKHHDAVWVPGASGRRLMRAFGQPDNCIYEGIYGATPKTFFPGPALDERPKQLLFVGQMIERKGVDLLAEAFAQFHARHPQWQLHAFGRGPLAQQLEGKPGIVLEDFQQPVRIADEMRQARALVLPSLEDHWPLVVHESVSCGCALACTRTIGCTVDFLTEKNGVSYAPGSSASLLEALEKLAGWSEDRWRQAGEESLQLAQGYGPERFASVFTEIIERLA
ncbi:MAG: glycosyltransferase family 4 protein [Opitutales bacterium]